MSYSNTSNSVILGTFRDIIPITLRTNTTIPANDSFELFNPITMTEGKWMLSGYLSVTAQFTYIPSIYYEVRLNNQTIGSYDVNQPNSNSFIATTFNQLVFANEGDVLTVNIFIQGDIGYINTDFQASKLFLVRLA